jgi:hypothetical protein
MPAQTPIEKIGHVLRSMRNGAALYALPRPVTVLDQNDRREAADWLNGMANELEAAFFMLRIPVQAMPQIIEAEFVEVRS